MPTYAEYAAAGGRMGEEGYVFFARRAWAYLDTMTFGRAANALPGVAQKVKDACFALTDEFARQDKGGELVSANNDGYSETYAASGKAPEVKLYDIVVTYLAATGLLFRGAY